MGLKRITFTSEVTYPQDDPRDFEELKSVTAGGVVAGITDQGGTVARVGILAAAQDPDPEPSADDFVPAPVEPEQP